MKFMVIVLLVAACHAIDVQSKKTEDNKTDKRELSRGPTPVEKRAPAISTVSPSITPGIEYADSKESQQDKSPTHQIYATPLPPVSKISDVLTGQGPPFQSAIASHLYAPVSVYQPRLGSPTTYEVSAPVASNLAYSEHRVSLQPSPNALQFSQKPLQKPKNTQQILIQQPLTYPQTLGPIGQPIYQQISQPQYQEYPTNVNQYQVPLYPVQQQIYQNQPVQIAQPVQPGNAYSPESQAQTHQPTQRELKPQPESKTAEKQVVTQNYVQPQGAVSFAKFSQLQPIFGLQPQQKVQYHLQPQPQPQYQQQLQYQPQQPQIQVLQQPQIQYQPHQQYQILPQVEHGQQLQALQYSLQPELVQQQSQPQIQYQPQPQLLQTKHQPQPHSQPLLQPQPQLLLQPQHQPLPQQQMHLQPISKATNVGKISYLRPGPVFLQSQYPQSHEMPDYRSNVAVPTYPPVQYFGKYAQSIFGDLQH